MERISAFRRSLRGRRALVYPGRWQGQRAWKGEKSSSRKWRLWHDLWRRPRFVCAAELYTDSMPWRYPRSHWEADTENCFSRENRSHLAFCNDEARIKLRNQYDTESE